MRHFEHKQSELKSREQFAALRPIASRIRHRIIEIADLLSLAVEPVPSVFNKLEDAELLLHRHPLLRIFTRQQG